LLGTPSPIPREPGQKCNSLAGCSAEAIDTGATLVSGIAAVVSLDGSGIPRSEVERMANVLKPYGPDRQRILTRGNAAFVFCLHKLTPEDDFEIQPLLFVDRFVMLFDGRIDNRSELGGILSIPKSELYSMPDSRLALRLFDRWGERAFERIVGDFAIIIMDLQDGRLICARDHMGLRVLHYHRSAERFAVATVPEALFALSWVPRILNKERLADNLVGRGGNHETTYYQDVFRVLPGSIVRVRGSTLLKHHFWDPEGIADVRFTDDHDYVEAFKERLDEAVRARLRSCRPPCATITGGLDSSSIAVIAADILAASGKRLNTFTAVPEAGFAREELRGRYFDETPYVRRIAEANRNIVPHFITQSRESIPEKIAEVMQMCGLPGGILNSLWGVDILAAARSAGHHVMLVGELGNITMSYHGWGLFTELLLTGRWVRLFAEIRSSGYRWRRHVRQQLIAPLIPAPLFRRYKQWRRGEKPPWHDYSLIRPEFAARCGVIDRAAREYIPFDAPGIRDSRLGRINNFRDYCEMADWHSKVRVGFRVDIRAPACDRRVVEFCIGIPEDQYLHKGCDRWLIRRAMEGRLPNIVLNQKKCGAQAADWYPRMTRVRNQIVEEVNRLAENPEVASILNMQRLTAILDNWPDNQPSEYTSEESHLLAVPTALGAAYFIENVTGANQIAVGQ
jgi:asparagine synthase (glutamine-hydrolysing)